MTLPQLRVWLRVWTKAHHGTHASEAKALSIALARADQALKLALDGVERTAIAHALAHEREHASTQLAIDKATIAMDRRLDGMNQFRDQLRDQAGQFLHRDTYDQSHTDVLRRIEILERGDSRDLGRTEYGEMRRRQDNWVIGTIVAVVAVLIAVINFVSIHFK